MDVYEVVKTRRSVRKFQDKPVPYEALEKSVDAGRLAASARNRQLCEFIVVDDADMLAEVFDNITMWAGKPKPKGTKLGMTPRAYILILVNSALEAEMGASRGTTCYDVGLAVGSIMLTACGEGLASCPLVMMEEEGLKGLLAIPDSYDLSMIIALGYPAEAPVAEVAEGSVAYWVDKEGVRHVPKRKLADILHRNRF